MNTKQAFLFILGILIALTVVASCAQPLELLPEPTEEPDRGPIRAVSTPVPGVRPSWVGFCENNDYIPFSPDPSYSRWKNCSHEELEWNLIEPTDQNFSWSWLDPWITRVDSYGWYPSIAFSSQAWSPGQSGSSIFLPADLQEPADEGAYYMTCDGVKIPKYWRSEYLTQMTQLATAMADHIENDAQGQKIKSVVLPLGNFGELSIHYVQFWPCILTEMTEDDNAGQLSHLTVGCSVGGCTTDDGAAIWNEAAQNIIDVWADAFDPITADVILTISPTNYSFRNWTRREVSAYARSRGVGVSHNKVTEDMGESVAIPRGNDDGHWGSWDPILDGYGVTHNFGYMIDSSSDDGGTGGFPSNPPFDTNLIEQQYWSIFNAIDGGMSRIVANFDNVGPWRYPQYTLQYTNMHVSEAMDIFLDVAGTDMSNTPYVLSALRETQETNTYARSRCGNFEHGLTLLQCGVPATFCEAPDYPPPSGGCTVPVWDAIPAVSCWGDGVHQNPGSFDPNCDPRGRFARRTNPTTGNHYMYFDVDDAFNSGTSANIEVEVTYADVGDDEFRIECQDVGGNLIASDGIRKNGTNTWVTVLIPIDSCDLTGMLEGNSDIAINDLSDGQEIIHLVKMWAEDSPNAPTATPTWTPVTPSAPTPTPIPTISVTPTPPAVLVLNPNNNTWKDTHLMSQAANTPPGSWNTVGLRAGTVVQTPLPTQHPSTIKSGVIEVPFVLGNTPTAVALKYYVQSAGSGSGTAYVKPCQVVRDWVENEATWNRASSATVWQTPGAYGTGDVGTCGTPVPIATTDVGHYVSFDVKNLVDAQGLSVKLEPWCTPNTSGYCNADYFLNAAQAGGINQPRLEVWINPTALTSTPTPTITETGFPTSTRTPTPTKTPTRTPTWTLTYTPTLTPTRTPTWTPGAYNTATPTPTGTPTPTRTPTPTPTSMATATTIFTATPTPVGPNIKINEVCSRMTNVDLFPDGILGNDNAIELFNPTTRSFILSGYRLCTNLKCVNLNGDIGARSYKVFYEALGETELQYANERVYIQSLDPPYNTIDSVTWASVYPNQCYKRIYDGAPTWTNTYLPSIGFGNSAWAVTVTPTATSLP